MAQQSHKVRPALFCKYEAKLEVCTGESGGDVSGQRTCGGRPRKGHTLVIQAPLYGSTRPHDEVPRAPPVSVRRR